MEEKTKKGSLRWKLVLFTTLLALITYSISAVFMYLLYDYIQTFVPISEFWFVMATLALGIIWSGILAYAAAGFITRPLTRLESVAVEAAQGNLTKEVELPKSKDEIHSLSFAFNTMLGSLKQIILKIENNFAKTNDKVEQIKTVSSRAAAQTKEIEEAIQHISAGAENSSNSIQNTAESIEASTRLAQQVQNKADQSRKNSQDMVAKLSDSKTVIHRLVSGIQSLAQEQENSLEDVTRLEKNAQEVENIIGMVGDISEQTNLLALNASIEAARAGEHGKGFAVVAEEVRKLADQSTQAVQGISELIANIQTDVQQVVNQITEQVTFARTEAEKGEETNAAINTMSVSINEVVSTIEEISQLVDEQLQAIQKTSVESQEVSAIAEETSASAEEMTAIINEQSAVIASVEQLAASLEDQAKVLNKEIHQFKIKEEEVVPLKQPVRMTTKMEKGA
nr:HAMP domain-containing methyl-accepting chemotaxis protein [Sediminibacillus dalangtanensis]